jgi:hypothetical protein
MIKSRRTRWVGHVACMGEMTNTYKILVGKSEGKRPRDPSVDRRIILQWLLDKQGGKVWNGFIWCRIVTMVGFCGHSNEPSKFHKRHGRQGIS